MTTFLYKKLGSEESKASSSLDKQSLFSIIFFRWVNGVIENCKRSPLTIDDLCPLSTVDEPEVVTKKLEEAWNQELCGQPKCVKPRLWKAIARFLSKRECFIVMLLAFMRSTCLLLICVLLYFLLREITEEAEEVQNVAIFCVSSICVCAGVISLSVSHFQFRGSRLGMKVRTAITGLLYKKVRSSSIKANMSARDLSQFSLFLGYCLLCTVANWLWHSIPQKEVIERGLELHSCPNKQFGCNVGREKCE